MSKEETSKPSMPEPASEPAPTGNPGTTTDLGPEPSTTSEPAPTGNEGTRGIK